MPLVTTDERVLVTREGRVVAVLAGEPAALLARGLVHAANEEARQLLLAGATGDDRLGDNR